MANPNRPLSPHLQVYRLPLTALMSISHRITGIGLTVGTLLLTCWVVAAASGPSEYAAIQAFLGSWFGLLLLFGFSFALFFHLCNGIRHLVWDAGRSFELEQVRRADMMVMAGAAALTVITWIMAL